jgi:hypothetical protein
MATKMTNFIDFLSFSQQLRARAQLLVILGLKVGDPS